MNVTTWIIIGVVALLIILALIIVLGLRRKKSKEISFEKKDEVEAQKPSSGDYQAQGGFNFTSGGGATGTTTIGGVTVEDATAQDKEPVDKEPVDKEPVDKAPKAEPKTSEESFQTPQLDRVEDLDDDADLDVPEGESPASIPSMAPMPEPVEEMEFDGSGADADAVTKPEPEAEPEPEPEPEAEPEPEPEPEPRDEIAPVQGRLGKLRGNLSKSQNFLGKGVLGILSAGDLDEDAWEEIEDTLIMADLGAKTTTAVVDDLRERIAVNGVSSEDEARAMLRAALIDACKPDLDRSIKAMPYDGKPAVIMVVGVNGTGKTTTTGKLSRVLVGMGHKVLLGAADTFRAAAADQLETWGRRVGADTVRGKEGADPASVAFDAVAQGTEDGVDVVLVDTAGRLHTSVGLMDQLGKVKRVVEKKAKVDEVLLVLDATVGQNGLTQARVFREVVDISGVVLTKLDGTAKGGIVFQVQEELGVPVKLVGLGEGADHLAPFEVESFVDALLG